MFSGLDKLRSREIPKFRPPPEDMQPTKSILHQQKQPALSSDSHLPPSPINSSSNPNTSSQYEAQSQYQPRQTYQSQPPPPPVSQYQPPQPSISQPPSSQQYQSQQYSNHPSQQQYQTQQTAQSQSNYQPQSYQNQQAYLGQDKLPQAMITPPTPLPEAHKVTQQDSVEMSHSRTEIRRNSRQVNHPAGESPSYNFQQVQ